MVPQPSISHDVLDAALGLYNKNTGLPDGMRNMFCADRGVKDVAALQNGRAFFPMLAVAHLDAAIQNGKDLFASIDVPLVRSVSPMESRRNAAHVGDIERAPRPAGGEFP